jgi:8-oxo-dGTP pyrophosphatase MutT (NUDIX family)
MTETKVNDSETPWFTLLNKRLVYSERQNKWIKVYFDEVRSKNGQEMRHNRIVEGTTERGVVIIPKDQKGRICLVRIYRYPIGKWQWELPRGFAESPSSAKEDAARELLEETKFQARRLTRIGEVYPNSGVLSTKIDAFMAEELTEKNPPSSIDDPISKICFFTKDELGTMVKKGELTDGITLSVLYLAGNSGLI